MREDETFAGRSSGRRIDALRPVTLRCDVLRYPEGSVEIECGDTRVLAAASVERRVPPFLIDSGRGWVTAEYAMLPRATHTRSQREVSRGKVSGRTAEIQRLIGRALRAVVDTRKLPDRTVTVDCDVLQADGGTRTASITAAYVALELAVSRIFLAGDLAEWPLIDSVSAVSVGLVEDQALLDLEYVEDSRAQVDLNVVVTGSGDLVEIQGTGEQRGFSRGELERLLDLAFLGVGELANHQAEALAEVRAEVAAARERRRRGPAAPKDERSLWKR
ncbi:MAG: ribonuclease PH [Acidobacteria bacterium]|nr:MAG: ribonuclease PH [Acidobacteriota bacterium]REK03706.1 MAG: ribonuclease PH [Acidobacteriota bacterium]